jgi:hypothetical protein
MTPLFLILHLVRGEPAFDIAQRCDASDGWGTTGDPAPWWIIPTSGRRAYPYYQWQITQLWFNREYVPTLIEPLGVYPDHYPLPLPAEPRPLKTHSESEPRRQAAATSADIDALIG